MTKDFTLDEFLHSRFFAAAGVQDKVIESYQQNTAVQNNIKVLAEQLQIIRDYVGQPITINIAYRPHWWEKMRGRNGKSQHCLGKAADIVVKGMGTKELHKAILELIEQGKIVNGGVGLYNTFIHYDIRPYPARWKR